MSSVEAPLHPSDLAATRPAVHQLRSQLAHSPPWPSSITWSALAIILIVAAFLLGGILGNVGPPSLRTIGDLAGAICAGFSCRSIHKPTDACRLIRFTKSAIALTITILLYGTITSSLKFPTLPPPAPTSTSQDHSDFAQKVQTAIGNKSLIYGHGYDAPSQATADTLTIITSEDRIQIHFHSLRTKHDGGTVLDGQREGGIKRQYDGYILYTGTFSQTGLCLKIENITLGDYALAPTGGLWSRLIGWIEIDYSMMKHQKTYQDRLIEKFREACTIVPR